MAKPSLTQWLRQPTLSWRLQIVAFRHPTRSSGSLEQSRLVKLPSCAQTGTRRGMLSGRTVRSRIRWRSHVRPMRRTVAPAAPLGPCRRHCRNASRRGHDQRQTCCSRSKRNCSRCSTRRCACPQGASTTGAPKHACAGRAHSRTEVETDTSEGGGKRVCRAGGAPAGVRGATRLSACKNLQHAG